MEVAVAKERHFSPHPPMSPVRGNASRIPISLKTSECELVTTDEPCLMFLLRRKMARLYMCENHSCVSCLQNTKFIQAKTNGCSQIISKQLLSLGFLELSQHIWRQYFKVLAEHEAESVLSSASLALMISNCAIVVNMTESSSEACQKIIDMDLYVDLIVYLKSNLFDLCKINKTFSSDLFLIVHSLMMVLYNVIRAKIKAREMFREQGIVQVLQHFLTKSNETVSGLAMILLIWVANDDECYIMHSDKTFFEFLEKELNSALSRVLHCSQNGYKSTEILAAINKLAASDKSKSDIIEAGIISSYSRCLDLNADVEEQFLAAEGLWSLAFECADDIKKEKACIESLKSLYTRSDNDRVKRRVKGVLTALGVMYDKANINSGISTEGFKTIDETTVKMAHHIYISYEHTFKDVVFRIRDRLRDRGYTVLIDVDEMSECSPARDDVAEGIDKSSVVLSCLSQRYYESPCCKKEVIYAHENKKDIVPLTMEPKYTLHGWLSFVMGDRLRIDFSEPQSFDESFSTLLRRLKKSNDDFDKNSQCKSNVNLNGCGVVLEQVIPKTEANRTQFPKTTVDMESMDSVDRNNAGLLLNGDCGFATTNTNTTSESNGETFKTQNYITLKNADEYDEIDKGGDFVTQSKRSDTLLSADNWSVTMDDNKNPVEDEVFDRSPESISCNSLMREVGHKIIELHCCNELSCVSCLETWRYVDHLLTEMTKQPESTRFGDFLVSVGFVELLKQLILNETENGHVAVPVWPYILMNLTDLCQSACFELIHLKLHETIIERLKIGALMSVASSMELGILYNVIQVVETARESFRELKIVELLKHFIQNRGEDDDLYFTSIILMAWVINEDENDIIDNKDVFNYLEQQLKSSLEDGSHRSHDGYKSTEILAVINKLAVNDANTKRIIESGILHRYASFLSPSCDYNEQFLAAQGVWNLTLIRPEDRFFLEDIKKETACIRGLESLLQNQETNDNVKVQATGALRELNLASEVQEDRQMPALTVTKGKEKSKQIFISYQHGNKDIVHQVKDGLTSCSFQVWIDSERMRGSIADDICDGIDSCSIILAFLSQKYYESPYCKKELIYAAENNKEIIPLTVEPRYNPHGWLSFHIADKLRIDFGGLERFEDSMNALKKRLNEILGAKDYESIAELVIIKKIGHQITETPNVEATMTDVNSWTKAEVKAWLKKHGLKILETFFEGYNGKMLLEYKSSLFKDAPETTTKHFLKSYSFKHLCTLKLALKDF